jgi:hypothetical protein
MKKAAQSVGGENYLLLLVEAMKAKKPNPLIFSECQIASNHTIIKWNKVVFKDKADVLGEILLAHKSYEGEDFNILENENSKKRKNILNMIKTLIPLEFVVTPQNHHDGTGFSFKVFERVEEEYVKLNPIFIALFFCSVEYIKKSLNYKVS